MPRSPPSAWGRGNPSPEKLRRPLRALSAAVTVSPFPPILPRNLHISPIPNTPPGHIDTAFAYQNETEVGVGIKASGVPREQIWLTTKLDNPWHKRVAEGIDASLKNLGTDYVDLYLIHWPCSTNPNMKEVYSDWDYVDTWREMQKLVETGKVKNIGVSNFGQTHLERLLADPSCKVSHFPALKPLKRRASHHAE